MGDTHEKFKEEVSKISLIALKMIKIYFGLWIAAAMIFIFIITVSEIIRVI